MENPYKILGVSENASDEQIKEVYRELCKKYHPDLNPDGLSREEAEEKMAQINAAYDEIVKSRRSGQSGYHSNSNNWGPNNYSGTSQFNDIRRLINQRRISEAEELLDGVVSSQRDAEWHFLKGSVLYSKGWFNDAYTHFQTACNMAPYNQEYRAALNQMTNMRNGHYGGGYRTNGSGDCDTCSLCSNLICLDCLCESCGGDLIPCC